LERAFVSFISLVYFYHFAEVNQTIMRFNNSTQRHHQSGEISLPRRQVQRVCNVVNPSPGVNLLDATCIPEQAISQVVFVILHYSMFIQASAQRPTKLLAHNRSSNVQSTDTPPSAPNTEELRIMV
jgi:hypothetical protein